MTAAAHDSLMSVRSYQLQHMGLKVDGVKFNLRQYPYLADLFDRPVRRKTIVKGAQMGFTITFVLDAIMAAKEEGLRGIGYFFPTERDVLDFSKARFGPMISSNPAFAKLVKSTDSAGLKIVNGVPIYFRAAGATGTSTKQSLSAVKSFPADYIIRDERDEMQDSRVDAIRKRLDGSTCPREVDLSTPKIPGYGVDYEYQQSDGRAWHWQCDKCNAWTCLELTWPDCIAEPVGKEPFYLCSHCRGELRRHTGEAVAARPDVKDHMGLWVSQLCSPTKTAGDILKALEDAEHSGRKQEFYNQTLARAWAPVSDQLTKERLDDCLTEKPRALSSPGPTCAGADPGVGKIHWLVKQRIGDRDSQVLNYGACASFADLAAISRKYNVQTGVIDQMAETHATMTFVDAHPNWWGARYVTAPKPAHDWQHNGRIVVVGRNEALDASHAKIIEKRERLPAPDELYHDLLIPQMCNMARVQKFDEVTGDPSSRWVILGGQKNDHLKHCHGYATVAEERVGLARELQRARSRPRSRPRSFMRA